MYVCRYNASAAGAGMVGGVLPTALFYLPMLPNGTSRFRHWSVMAVPIPDMKGRREQGVWLRYQQAEVLSVSLYMHACMFEVYFRSIYAALTKSRR